MPVADSREIGSAGRRVPSAGLPPRRSKHLITSRDRAAHGASGEATMKERGTRRINWEEAARLIYQTPEPTIVQVNKVGYKVVRGVLEGNVKGKWVALDSVVAYLAARSEHRRMEKTSLPVQPRGAGSTQKVDSPQEASLLGKSIPQRERQQFSQIYQQSVQDYFAAVFRRRYPDQATSFFLVTVWIGQIAIILLPLLVIGYGYSTAVAPPPEQAAIENWLKREVGEYQIVKWFPPQPREDAIGKTVRVQYRYFTRSRKPILTDRLFLVKGEQVTFLSNSGSD